MTTVSTKRSFTEMNSLLHQLFPSFCGEPSFSPRSPNLPRLRYIRKGEGTLYLLSSSD
jgi:hypothetical protein